MQDQGWFQDHLLLLNFGVLSITAIVVIWYTRETYLLRKAAQRQVDKASEQIKVAQCQYETSIEQLRASFKPILVCDFNQDPAQMGVGKLGLKNITVCNIGVGAAFNVEIVPIEHAEYRVEFDRVDYLVQGAHSTLSFALSQAGVFSGFSKFPNTLGRMLLCKDEETSVFDLTLTYDDCAKNRYSTHAQINVDHLSGQISLIYSF